MSKELPHAVHLEPGTPQAPSHHDSSHRLYEDATVGPKGHTPPMRNEHQLPAKSHDDKGHGAPKTEEDGIASMLHGFGIF